MTGTRIGRRTFLSASAGGLAAAGLSGCTATEGGDGGVSAAATYIPGSYEDISPGIEMFLETATELSGGELAFDLFDSGTLLGPEQLLPGLLLGTVDVMFTTSSYLSSTYPILGAMELPFVTDDFDTYVRAISPDGPQHQLVNELLAPKGVRILGGFPTTLQYLWTVDRPIREPGDMRGMRIRVAGENEGETIKAMGGSPVSMSSAEVYQALERNTIDGIMSYLGTIISRDLQGIINYGTVGHFGAYTVDAYCRLDWYEQQPPELRRALDEAGMAMYTDGGQNLLDVHESDYLPEVEAAGTELIDLTPDELGAFHEAVTPVYGLWERRIEDQADAERAVRFIRNA